MEHVVRLSERFQEDQIDGSGDPQRAPGWGQSLGDCKVRMVLMPLEARVGEELTTLTERKPSPGSAGHFLPLLGEAIDNGWPQPVTAGPPCLAEQHTKEITLLARG